MKKVEKSREKQTNLENTLEFLSLDDDTIESYKQSSSVSNTSAYVDEMDEEEYDEEEYTDEEYDDEEYGEEEYDEEEYEEYYEEDYAEYSDEDEEDEYGDEDEEDEEDEYEEVYRGNIFDRIGYVLVNMTPLDYVVAVFGCFVLIAAVAMGVVYTSSRATNKQVEAFAEIGTEIEGIGIIGESGLIAVSDAESARLSQMIEEQPEELPEQEVEGESHVATVEVSINLTSIKSDLKIKFVNAKTKKLIGSVPFEVEVSGVGKTYNLKDEDKDGIIYQTGVDAGTYTVKVIALQGEAYEKYSLPSQGQTIKVVDTIEYKKVDVEDEIKTEAEVNVAVEDTAQQDTAIESTLTDTVEWVESKRTELNPDNNYQEVNKSDIPDPANIARAAGFMKFTSDVSGNSGENKEEAKYTGINITGDSSIQVGKTGKVTGTTEPEGGTIEWSSSNTDVVTVDAAGNLKGVSAGTAKITGTCKDDNSNASATFEVTVTEAVAETVTYTVKIGGDSTSTIQVGKTGKVTGTTEPAGGAITWSSSDSNIVTVDADGKLTGVSVGKAIITGTCGEATAKFEVVVTVESYTAIKIEGDSKIQVGKTGKVTGTTEPAGGAITWSSSDSKIVTVDADGKLTGVSAGKAIITATCKDNSAVKAAWEVTVVKDVSGDTTSKLKDKNGNQIYIKDSAGNYIEAVYADYYKNVKFYLKKSNTAYFYTGWQTIDGYTYFYDKNGKFVTGEQVIQGAKYSFDSNGRLSSGSGALGIDVSKWNGSIDWNAVKNSGISYVIIRCGYRGSTTGALIEDSRFRANIQGAQNAGIKVGVYFFTQAVNDVEAVEEASMVLSLIKGYNLSCPVFLDVEATSGNNGRADKISVDSRTAVCKAFCQTIQNSGYKAGIYANKTWLTSYINTPSLAGYKIWLAQYAAAPSYTRTRYDMWQYSAKGTVGGISGQVDMNISYISY